MASRSRSRQCPHASVSLLTWSAVSFIAANATRGIKAHPGLYLGSLIRAREKQKASTLWPTIFEKAAAALRAHTAAILASPSPASGRRKAMAPAPSARWEWPHTPHPQCPPGMTH